MSFVIAAIPLNLKKEKAIFVSLSEKAKLSYLYQFIGTESASIVSVPFSKSNKLYDDQIPYLEEFHQCSNVVNMIG